MEEITLAVTSCGRFDLLRHTLDSFLRHNTYPIARKIIIEDSGVPDTCRQIFDTYDEEFEVIFNFPKLGHIHSLDRLYGTIETPYIFHCEDDWEFTQPGFIEKSLEVLRRRPEVVMVTLRALHDTMGHPVEEPVYDDLYRLVTPDHLGVWSGFSLNPGLRRLSDYHLVAPYAQHGLSEADIAAEYKRRGFRGAILLERYVVHIGDGRHVFDPFQGF
ncbi:MAG: glycosyltransferase [Bacteroidota bacterium]